MERLNSIVSRRLECDKNSEVGAYNNAAQHELCHDHRTI